MRAVDLSENSHIAYADEGFDAGTEWAKVEKARRFLNLAIRLENRVWQPYEVDQAAAIYRAQLLNRWQLHSFRAFDEFMAKARAAKLVFQTLKRDKAGRILENSFATVDGELLGDLSTSCFWLPGGKERKDHANR